MTKQNKPVIIGTMNLLKRLFNMQPDPNAQPGQPGQPDPNAQPDPQPPATPPQQDPDNSLIVGGPGGPAPNQQPTEPDRIDKLTTAIGQLAQSVDTRFSNLEQAAAQIAPTVDPPKQDEAPEDDVLEKLWSNPKGFVDDIKKEVVSAVTDAQQKQTALNDFWGNFYASNPELDRNQDDIVAKQIMQTNWSQLEHLPIAEASKQLGTMVKDHYLNIHKRFATPNQRPTAEVSDMSAYRGTPPQDAQPAQPGYGQTTEHNSLSSLLRQRRAARGG